MNQKLNQPSQERQGRLGGDGGEGISVGDQEERTVASLLNPIPGEEDDEQVPDIMDEGLLQETEEAEEEEEEVKEEVEMLSVQVE